MKNLFKNYGWLIKFIGAAILITFGVVMLVTRKQQGAMFITVLVGFIIVISVLFRVVPLMKTLHRELLRTINLLELIANLFAGGFMLYWGFSGNATETDLYFGYLIGAILFARGLIFFMSTSLLGEKTEHHKFWFHIAVFSVAVFMITMGINQKPVTPETLAWILLFVSAGIGGYLAFDGGGGYKRYRYEVAQRKATEVTKIKPVMEAPTVDKKEETPIEDPKKDQPTVQ